MRIGKLILFTVLLFLLAASTSMFAMFASASTQVTFGVVRDLTNNPAGTATAPVIGAVGSHIYVSWEAKPSAKQHIQTFFKTSSDGGKTWGPTKAFSGMVGGANAQTSAVQIAAHDQYVFLTWQQGSQTGYALSADYGAHFRQNGTFAVPGTLNGSMSGQAVSSSGGYGYFTWSDQLSAITTKKIVFVQAHDNGSGVFSLTTPKAISGTLSAHGEDEVASSGNYVYVVWDSIWVSVSKNNGVDWTKAVQLKPPNISGLSREPMIAACGANVYVTYPSNASPDGSYQAFIRVNNKNGNQTSWSPAKDLSFGYLSSARELQVACIGSNVYVTSRGSGNGTLQYPSGINQYVYISNNSGMSFSPPLLLEPKLPGAENGFGGLAVDGSNVYVLWEHVNETRGVQQTFFSASQDNGITWAPNQQLSNSASGVVGYGDPSGGQGPMVAGSNGHVYAVWVDNGDIMFVASS